MHATIINIYRYKNLQQIISKSNTTTYEKNYIPQLSGIYPKYSSSNIQKAINVIHHINRVKKKNHIIISLNTEKHLSKFNIIHDLKKKTQKTVGIEGNFLNLIKIIYKKSIGNIILSSKK